MGEERRNLVSWYSSIVEMRRVFISTFTKSVTLLLPAPFLGHLYSCQAGTRDGGGEGEAAVVKLLWPAWRYFRSATRKIPGF